MRPQADTLDELLTPAQRALFTNPNFAFVATTCPDGYPHVSPVWIDIDDEHILVNTAAGRVKERNLRRDPRVAVSLYDEKNPYRMVAVQGRAVEITADGADDHIDNLYKKYRGGDSYPNKIERRIVKIKPERVATMGF
jgi:PPOX class probable F420-dependent enzyme